MKSATALQQRPLLSLIHDVEDCKLPDSVISASHIPSLAHISLVEGGGSEMQEIFVLLRQTVISQETLLKAPPVWILLNLAEAKIRVSLVRWSSEAGQPSLAQLMLQAAEVFIYALLRQVPTRSPVLAMLVSRLQQSLSSYESASEASIQHLSMLAWILSVAAITAAPAHEPEWMAIQSRLKKVCRSLHLAVWAELENVLRMFVWKTRQWDMLRIGLWVE